MDPNVYLSVIENIKNGCWDDKAGRFVVDQCDSLHKCVQVIIKDHDEAKEKYDAINNLRIKEKIEKLLSKL